MDWVAPFYTQKSTWFGPSDVLPHHQTRAAAVQRLCGAAPKRVLELGAGAGGSAAATAALGYQVVAIELSPLRAHYARELAADEQYRTLTVIEGDFFTAHVGQGFDIVTYWNGFGTGTDADQIRLLQRIATEWLVPGGSALIDIFNPWPWARAAGEAEHDEELGLQQRNDFDPIGNRFLDHWWPDGREDQRITQSIRCYTPADFVTLLTATPLTIKVMEVAEQPIAWDEGAATMQHPLWNAWDYLVQLRHR